MPFKLNKATVSISDTEIRKMIRQSVEKEGYIAGKIVINYGEIDRGNDLISATVEVDFLPKAVSETIR